MNTLKFYPKKLRESYTKNIINSGVIISPEKYHNRLFWTSLILGVISLISFFFFKINILFALLVFIGLNILFYFKVSLGASSRIKKMELIFPDVVSLMASNLRAGITIDKAFLMAARPEFDPLDKEILKAGKEITTGRDILVSLQKMAERIGSEKIEKVVTLIISGLKAGGNISELLEQTSRNMKEKEVIEKKARSTILMYVIFIFFAVGVGAPVLFGLSSVLVEVVMNLTSNLPEIETAAMNMPFSFTEVTISLEFIMYFSLFFMTVNNLISCLVIGLVNKGEGKQGFKYFIPLELISFGVYFGVRALLSNIMGGIISFA